MKDKFRVDDRIAIVTGGLGQLGMQFSVSLCDYGAKVAVIDITTEKKKDNHEFDNYLNSGNIKLYKADITNRPQLEKTLDGIKKDLGNPSILINNAGIDSPPGADAEENGPFEMYPEESLNKVIDVNLKGVFLCCQVFGGEMAKNNYGSIINIASVYGIVSPNQDVYEYKRKDGQLWYKPASYAVTKSAILNLTRYLATYWAKKNVRVNTLSPAGIFNNQDKDFLEEYKKRMPLGRMAKEDEMNGAIIFLASEASSYMTGSNLIIDGGWTAW
jgi:NAD(P)-dependent dehydrogenase (short-subunit alcohol dehydrogenase family)